MSNYVALGFLSHEDFLEVCDQMQLSLGDTATSSDGMFTVLIKTEKIIPQGTLVVTGKNDKRIYIRINSGREIENMKYIQKHT